MLRIFALLLSLAAGCVAGSDVTVRLPSGSLCSIPIAPSTGFTVSPTSGDVFFRTTTSQLCDVVLPAPDAISVPVSLLSGSSNVVITLPSGSLCSIPIDTSASFTISPSTGDLSFRTTTSQLCGGSLPPGSPTFPLPLSATPPSLSPGALLTLSWSSQSSTSCTGSATRSSIPVSISGWSGTRPFISSGVSLQLFVEGSYRFSLSCSNANGTTVSTASPVVVGSGVGASCVAPAPLFGLARQTIMTNTPLLQGNDELPLGPIPTTSFSYFFGGGSPFPIRYGNGTLAVKAGHYIALEFRTHSVITEDFGGFEWFIPAANSGQPTVVVSTCAGDFVSFPPTIPASANSFCRSVGVGQVQMPWGVNSSHPWVCRLQPNTTYFLNVAYVDPDTGGVTCASPEPGGGSNPTSCHFFMQPR